RVRASTRRSGTVHPDTAPMLPVPDWGEIHSDPVDPSSAYERTTLLGELPDEAIDTMVDLAGAGSESPMALVEVRQLGGALGREPEVPAAIGHRDAAFTFFTIGMAPP